MTFFIIVGCVGFVLFIVSLFGGGEHDFEHDGVPDGDASSDGAGSSDGAPIFSFRTIVIFMTTFGAAGAIAKFTGLSIILSSVVGIVTGVSFGLFAWWLMNLAFKQQASSLVTGTDLIGKTAIVNIQIRDGNLGEIAVEVKGQRMSYHAKSKDGSDIKESSAVKILENRGVFVIVEPVQ